MEKLVGDLTSTGEGTRGQYAWGTGSRASPDLHVIEPPGENTVLNAGNGGCRALSCTAPAHKWGLVVPLASLAGWFPPRQDPSTTQSVAAMEPAAHTSADMVSGSFRAFPGAEDTSELSTKKKTDLYLLLLKTVHDFLQEPSGHEMVMFLPSMYPH